jgi:peptidoglycan/LPS O-acetylase OafA/YrhL
VAGLISYGIYLWQNVWVEEYVDRVNDQVFAIPFDEMLLVVLMLTLVCAAISYVVIERPVLRLKDRVPFSAHRAR